MSAVERQRSLDPGTFFLIASLLVGVLYCIFIPYGAGFDEERHLVRIYYMSQYHFLPNFPNPIIHEDVFDLSYQRRLVQTPAFDLFDSETFWRRFGKRDEDLRYGQRTQSIYSPVIFLPQALIGRALWWKFDFPILPTIMLERAAGLLMYIVGCYVAIRAAPYGKWILATVALLPAALYQASTLNADAFTAAVSFAFIGWVIAVCVQEHSGVRPRSIWILFMLVVLLGLAKPGAIILLPLLLILLKRPFPSKKWMLLLGVGVLLSILLNIGWWMLASQGSTFSGGGDQSVSRQSSLILADPVGFLIPLVQGILLTLPDQFRGWVAAYGYWAGTVPGPVYFFSAVALVGALLAEPRPVQIPAGTRIFLVGLFLFCCTAIYGIAFAANYATGGVLALAKHGRYFIPFTPLFFLGVAGLPPVRENLQRPALFIAMAAFLLAAGWFSFGIYTTYYTYCGYEAYMGGKCTLPLYKNLEKEGAPEVAIQTGTLVSQTFTNQCGDLEMVQIFMKSVPVDSRGSLRLSLLDANQHVLASRDFAPHEIIVEDYLSLPVKMPADFEGTNFEIQLEAVDLPPAQEFRAMLTRTDYYPGQLVVNGTSAGRNDLLIHYLCASP